MEIQALIQRAMDIHTQYVQREEKTYGRDWTGEEVALDFVGDVWDLTKLILGYNGTRHIPETEQKLAGKLAECLWSVIVLAQLNHVDLEEAFTQTMDDLEQHLSLQ